MMPVVACREVHPEPVDGVSGLTDDVERALQTFSLDHPNRAAIERIVRALEARGAANTLHSGRTFIHHLVGTWRILHLWRQSTALCHAGLLHSVYGTQYFRRSHFSSGERDVIRELASVEAEEIAYLFCALDRRELVSAAVSLDAIPEQGLVLRTCDGGTVFVPAARVAELLALEAANVAEQACESSGAPGRWVARLTPIVRLAATRLPLPASVVAGEVAPCPEAESRALASYAAAMDADFGRATERAARSAVSDNPWVGEPWLALACARLERGAPVLAFGDADVALKRLLDWGTAWDKRHRWQSWCAAALRVRAEAGELIGARVQAARDLAHAARFDAAARSL